MVGKLDLERKLKLFNNDSKLKFGTLGSFKEREYDIYSFRINVPDNMGILNNGNPDDLLKSSNLWSPNNIFGNHIALYTNGGVEKGKNYDANQLTLAGYSSIEFKIGIKLKSVIGIRAEKFIQKYSGENSGGTINYQD